MESESLRKGATYPAPVFLPPSSAASSSLLFSSRIPAHLFHFPLSFIYLVIHILMRNRLRFHGEGRSALVEHVWTAAPDWKSPWGWLDIVRWALFLCTVPRVLKINLFSFNTHMLWNSPIVVPFSLAAERLSLPRAALWPRSSSYWLAVEAFRIAR